MPQANATPVDSHAGPQQPPPSRRAPRHTLARGILALLLLAAASAHTALAAALHYRLNGLTGALRDNASAHLSTLELSCSAPRWQAEALLPSATRAIRRALEALGHYNASIKATLEQQKGCWNVRFDVQPGPPLHIIKLDLAITGLGRDAPSLRALLANPGLRLGGPLNQGTYDSLKGRLESQAHSIGYLDAHFTAHSILIDPARHTAAIHLILDTGKRYKFGPTVLHQNVLDPGLIRGLLDYSQGQPYSSDAVIASQNTLVGTGYFDVVRLRTEAARRAHDEVPMQLTLTGARRYQLQTGIGYATDTGPSLQFKLRNRRVNRAGDRYTFSSQLAPLQSNTEFKYQIPLSNPRTDWLTLSAGYQYEKTATAITHSWTAGITRTHQLGNLWLRTLSLQYLRENASIAGQSSTTQLLYPGIGFSRTHTNAPLYPTRGWSIAANLSGSLPDLISNVKFAQMTLDLKGLYPTLGGHVFARLNLGATVVQNITDLPVSLRFFAGGENSVRGYGYQSLGPTDSTGAVIGGRNLLTASLEYDHRLYGDFYGSVFYDAGNAFNNWPVVPYRGTGVGLNWHSPIGPIRIDFAQPLNGTNRSIHVYISIGARL
ncbi:hypothetical protein BW247_02415 [Acidihalobacter ferrooxydans]|uniref:Translocation and assembly module subunit TamA n=1 Tax=Acidihalobacter ferrooxydans TaxID=1765967 RepID=A0A1P8UE70_9GAMM|nr:hypothetical protein BW247_02415 [Acidihalobacter ferrooxydans]